MSSTTIRKKYILSTPEPTPTPISERVPMGVKLAYGMPSIAGAAMAIPIAIHMTKFYSDTIGLALGYIALAQALARAFDAITDPLMGWLSDRTQTRWGRRRPWMFIGAPLCAVAFVALFSPPGEMTELEAAVWFTTTFMLYFLFHTVYVIPHYGLGPELTLDYHERSSLFAWRDGFTGVGTMLASSVPAILVVILMQQRGLEQAGAERTVYTWFGIVMGTMLTLLYFWLCYRVPENPTFYKRKPNPLVPGVRRVMRNRPFRILLAVYLVASITGAIPGIFMPFYTQYVLKLENWFGWMGLFLFTYFASGVLFLPAWLWAARHYGKKPVWIFSFIMGITTATALFFLPLVFAGESSIWPMTVLLVWSGSAFGAGLFLNPAIQADVIDYDELYTGRRREAQYGALWAIVTKFTVIPGASIPLAILASIGFVPNVVQSETVEFTIRAIFGLAPAVFALLAMIVAFFFPISEPIHRAIISGIRAHERGESAHDPLTGKLLPPPSNRGLDEDTSWFLDHFSPGELRRALRQGPARLAVDTSIMAVLSLVIFAVATAEVVITVRDLSTRPGPLTVISVVVGGFALSGFFFHAIRLRAAVRMRSGAVPLQDLHTHLEIMERFSQRPTRKGAAG